MTHPASRVPSRARSRSWPRFGRRSLALAALPLTVGLLAGCGAYESPDQGDTASQSTPDGHPDVGSGTSQPSAPADGEGPSSGDPEGAEAGEGGDGADSDRADQRAAAAAAERAASFGFTEQAVATEEQVSGLREDVRLRQSNTTGTRVDPAQCKSALTAVDWSPLLAPGSAASRIDVGSPSFRGTGTVEVAALEDIGVVDQHVQNVDRLVQDCGELSFTVDGTFTGEGGAATFELASSVPQGETSEAVDSALLWTRTPVSGAGAPATAQVLVGQQGEHAVMVSFIGSSQVADEEFTAMAQAMLDAALAEL